MENASPAIRASDARRSQRLTLPPLAMNDGKMDTLGSADPIRKSLPFALLRRLRTEKARRANTSGKVPSKPCIRSRNTASDRDEDQHRPLSPLPKLLCAVDAEVSACTPFVPLLDLQNIARGTELDAGQGDELPAIYRRRADYDGRLLEHGTTLVQYTRDLAALAMEQEDSEVTALTARAMGADGLDKAIREALEPPQERLMPGFALGPES